MKDLKTIIAEAQNDNATFSLSASDLDKILYSLAFAAGWGSEVNSYNYKDYKKLFYDLLEGAKKSFNNDDMLPDKWYDYDLSHRGNCRTLD